MVVAVLAAVRMATTVRCASMLAAVVGATVVSYSVMALLMALAVVLLMVAVPHHRTDFCESSLCCKCIQYHRYIPILRGTQVL